MPSQVKRHFCVNALTDGRHAFLILVALVSVFWLPGLKDGKLPLYCDSAHFSLTLLWHHGQALAGHDALLWSSRILGGHPLFAEGQGGFANPLNILSAWLFEPVRALSFFHWLAMMVGGAGTFCLCRILGISRWSATFAAIAVVFSGSWIYNRHNLPVSACLAWVPWLLAASEHWIRQPSMRRAALMAIPVAFLVFSGYPLVTHGAVLYVLISLLAQFLYRESRASLFRQWRPIVATALLAGILALGLSAIQLMPLVELIGQSHRSQGIALIDAPIENYYSPSFYFQGLLYFFFGKGNETADMAVLASSSASSLAVLMLAGLAVFFRPPVRIVGHVLGGLFLFNLGMGLASPVFRFVYELNLIPGLHYFRIVYQYFGVAVIGIAIVAAYVLDRLSQLSLPESRGVLRKLGMLIGLAVYTGCLLYACYFLYEPNYSRLNFLAPALLILLYPLLGKLDKLQWFPLLAVLILALDVLTLRMHAIHFFDRQVLDQPETVRAIAAEPDAVNFHVMDDSSGGIMVFLGPADPGLETGYRRLLKNLSPSPVALQWKIPSINGVMALYLARRAMLDPIFEGEVEGTESNRPGLRLIDIFGIRYISRDAPHASPDLFLYAQDREQIALIFRNASAKPRFQVYWNASIVDTPEQALAGLKAARSETLFVERLPTEKPERQAICSVCTRLKSNIEVLEARAMRYRINVEVAQDAWLFLADANYPGWEATVNGVKQPVYSAQVLGKAVPLKAGRNEVVIRYVPRSFYWGVALSGLTLLLVLFILLKQPMANLRQRNSARP